MFRKNNTLDAKDDENFGWKSMLLEDGEFFQSHLVEF